MERGKATFAMGCFWSPQLLFDKVPGVVSTKVGYMGGDSKKKSGVTYEQVCSGNTGHAEVVQVIFNPKKITYDALLDLFWLRHNPTTKDRQGLDLGTQYRSAIFYHNAKQEVLAIDSKKKWQKKFDREIVTEIKPAKTFYLAEEYHQNYLAKRGKKTC